VKEEEKEEEGKKKKIKKKKVKRNGQEGEKTFIPNNTIISTTNINNNIPLLVLNHIR
jgi:hypothetical protein